MSSPSMTMYTTTVTRGVKAGVTVKVKEPESSEPVSAMTALPLDMAAYRKLPEVAEHDTVKVTLLPTCGDKGIRE